MNAPLTSHAALRLCRERAGSQDQMAADLGVSQPTISNWLNRAERIPAEYVLAAERLYGVSRHDLRPDIYPRETAVDIGGAGRFFGIDQHAAERGQELPSIRGAMAK